MKACISETNVFTPQQPHGVYHFFRLLDEIIPKVAALTTELGFWNILDRHVEGNEGKFIHFVLKGVVITVRDRVDVQNSTTLKELCNAIFPMQQAVYKQSKM